MAKALSLRGAGSGTSKGALTATLCTLTSGIPGAGCPGVRELAVSRVVVGEAPLVLSVRWMVSEIASTSEAVPVYALLLPPRAQMRRRRSAMKRSRCASTYAGNAFLIGCHLHSVVFRLSCRRGWDERASSLRQEHKHSRSL